MRKERERAKQAFEYAMQGLDVCVISAGDAGIYGMAPLIWEMYLQMKEQGEQKIGEPVRMKIKSAGGDGEKAWKCAEKFSGDDPDITGGKEIFATLRLNWEGSV